MAERMIQRLCVAVLLVVGVVFAGCSTAAPRLCRTYADCLDLLPDGGKKEHLKCLNGKSCAYCNPELDRCRPLR